MEVPEPLGVSGIIGVFKLNGLTATKGGSAALGGMMIIGCCGTVWDEPVPRGKMNRSRDEHHNSGVENGIYAVLRNINIVKDKRSTGPMVRSIMGIRSWRDEGRTPWLGVRPRMKGGSMWAMLTLVRRDGTGLQNNLRCIEIVLEHHLYQDEEHGNDQNLGDGFDVVNQGIHMKHCQIWAVKMLYRGVMTDSTKAMFWLQVDPAVVHGFQFHGSRAQEIRSTRLRTRRLGP
ncbi:hypothetical protein B0H10DRAFT_2323084 [Mycena sp. CBHHK59/15]|nr:hypothetical protein B0H10DRAFT_2323084 [Mycena sp. CBHHK59/15]